MNNMVNIIRNADRGEIDEIFDAALRRKRELYPDWAIYYAAVPRNNREERENTVRSLLRYLEEVGDTEHN